MGRAVRARAESTAAAVYAVEREGLLRFAVLLCGDHHRAEEAVAEVVARAWRALDRGSIDDPGSYLRRAVANHLIDRARRRSVAEREHAAPVLRRDQPLDERLADHDLLLRALVEVPIDQRVVLLLRFLEDRSEAETAAVLGISQGTVKSRTSRGIERLRQLLGEEATDVG